MPGGYCECNAPYCGRMCETNMAADATSNVYCSNMGWPRMPSIRETNMPCTCKCFTKNAEPVAYGFRCQNACPIGTNGDICGITGTPAPFDGGSCRCICNNPAISGRPYTSLASCDVSCKNGGDTLPDGTCRCLFANQDGTRDCAQCKDNYFIPKLGCRQYCGSETCLATGTCLADTETNVVSCQNCFENHNGRIIDIVQRSINAMPFATPDLKFSIENNGIIDSDKRVLLVQPAALLGHTPQEKQQQSRVWKMQPGDMANFTVPITQVLFDGDASTVYKLVTPVSIPIDYTLGYKVRTIVYEYTDISIVKQLCMDIDTCQGYSVSGILYSCVENGVDACQGSKQQAVNNSFVVAREAQLPAEYSLYNVSVVDSLRRGCAQCQQDWYPNPGECNDEVTSCSRECTSADTCNGFGTCNSCGKCVCDYDNMDSRCEKCIDNYFPDPGQYHAYEGTVPCQNKCIADSSYEEPPTWYCSGHGTCVGAGTCHPNCARDIESPESGWSGPHCNLACDSTENQTEICSGHGTCTGGRCTCFEQYHGPLCDVTCSQQDQFFYQHEGNCEGDTCALLCEEDDPDCEPCPGPHATPTCVRKRCNGGQCKTSFQYIHANKTVYYQPCTSTLDYDTLQECTGWRDETAEQWQARNLTAKKVREQEGIYCNTGARSDNRGFCAKAQCYCDQMSTTTQITGENGLPATSPIALSHGGEGCQIVGCRSAEFANSGSFTSFCGNHVPPTIRNPHAFYDTDNWEENLYEELRRVQQHCSHGSCRAYSGQPGLSESNPAPANVDAVIGSCKCRGTPKVEPSKCLTDTGPSWARSCWAEECCTAELGGLAPYFGSSCMDECICDRNMWWKGSCAGDSKGGMSLGCNCRQGYSETNGIPPGPRSALFCGMTCKSQCKGIIRGKQPLSSTVYMPDLCKDAVPSSPERQEGCYDELVPCNGHGECALDNGQCVAGNIADAGKCSCWGNSVSVSTVDSHDLLPGKVALFGGDACELQCPMLDMAQLSLFFTDNYELLHGSDYLMPAGRKTAKNNFYNMYASLACSGHGFCEPGAPRSGTSGFMKCTCLPNYGGDRCDKQCKLNRNAWGNRIPVQMQDVADNTRISDKLAFYYGLTQCGPNAKCVDEQCTQRAGGKYAMNTYESAKETVALLVNKPVDSVDVVQFFEQWSLMFVGEFATCDDMHYSSVPLQLDAVYNHHAFDLPPLVKWQLSRSCDAKYSANSWNQNNGPWCCKYSAQGAAWADDTVANYVATTHGGCPDTYCPNFATGRQCAQCISSSFTYYNPSGTTICPTSTHGYGNCAICSGTPDDHMVSPFRSLAEARATSMHYMLDGKHVCERCLSHGRELSGEQIYYLPSTESRVCNNENHITRGKCLGKDNTYSGIARNQADITDATTGSLLCEAGKTPSLQLGLCQCEEGWEGPTCAMPTKASSCGTGTLTSIGAISAFKHDNATAYNYCKCKTGEGTGHYCGGSDIGSIYDFASGDLMPCQSIQNVRSGLDQGFRVVECNDPTGKNPCDISGLCQTCAHKDLDPLALCIEYKASGPGGIVTAHQETVRTRAQC